MGYGRWAMRYASILTLLLLVACGPFRPASVALDRGQAQRGEAVTATLSGLDPKTASVEVGGVPAQAEADGPQTLIFTVPEGVAAGLQAVVVRQGGRQAGASLAVLGDVLSDRVDLIVRPDVTLDELRKRLAEYPFEVVGEIRPLSPSLDQGPCSGALAEIDVAGTPLGLALEQLKDLDDIALYIDPRSSYGIGAIDHLGAIRAREAHARGRSGQGVTIAVLDTGVSAHPELAGRLRGDLGFNALDPGPPEDDYDAPNSPGHGTPIAVLAAGQTLGVAPQAEVMPVKVCDGTGTCLSSHVILGLCHAVSAVEPTRLVLNLSLGGDTPTAALNAILAYALEQGAVVAAAGGNQGEQGSPTHYPAAFPLDGMLAVAALAPQERPCVGFEALESQSVFQVGDAFNDGGVTVRLEPFVGLDGREHRGGMAFVGNDRQAGGSGQELALASITLRFDFGEEFDGLSLRYGGSGAVSLSVNGEVYVTEPIEALDGLTLGGVAVAVEPDDTRYGGMLRLHGPMAGDGVALGGEYLWLDDICPVSWGPAVFSTRGEYLDLAAPGAGLTAGRPDGSLFAGYEGTSFATPLVAGALALWREAYPDLSPAEIAQQVKAVARPLAFPADQVGVGMLELAEQP